MSTDAVSVIRSYYWERGRPRPHTLASAKSFQIAKNRGQMVISRFALIAGEGARAPSESEPFPFESASALMNVIYYYLKRISCTIGAVKRAMSRRLYKKQEGGLPIFHCRQRRSQRLCDQSWPCLQK